MQNKLKCSESLPLFGKSIMVTRSAHQAAKFSEQLSLLGAEVIHRPTIEIRPPESFSELDEGLRNGNKFDWVIFTSVNGVRAFARRMKELNLDIRLFRNAKFAGIGSATRKAIRELGVRVDFVPKTFLADRFIKEFQQHFPDLSDVKVLFPAANLAQDVIPEKLRELGAEVTRVTAYETAAPENSPEMISNLIDQYKVNLVTFTSSSTVDNFFVLFPEQDLQKIKKKLNAASIGPMTSKTLRNNGIEPIIEAKVHTIQGLVEAIVTYYQSTDNKT